MCFSLLKYEKSISYQSIVVNQNGINPANNSIFKMNGKMDDNGKEVNSKLLKKKKIEKTVLRES